jgi:hypothetical protein
MEYCTAALPQIKRNSAYFEKKSLTHNLCNQFIGGLQMVAVFRGNKDNSIMQIM